MTPPWLTLLRNAIDGESPRPLILSLATVDDRGSPQVRSVVCRRVADDGSLWITSDSRSAKNAQLAARPQASAVYWAAASRQQLRFTGGVTIRTSPDDLERIRIWRELNAETKATFFWPTPGAARAPDEAFVTAAEIGDPPETFSVLVLEPECVDDLNVSVSPHVRRRWAKTRQWRMEELNP